MTIKLNTLLAGVCAALVIVAAPVTARVGPSPGRIAIVGAKVFPSPNELMIEDAVIVIKGRSITAVGPRRTTPVPSGYRIIDATGQSVTAGFWNSHVHLTTPVLLVAATASDASLQKELDRDFTRWGFTTVFDLASTTQIATEVKRRLTSGRVTGARILSVGEPFYPPRATPVYAKPFYEAFHLPSAEIRTANEAAERVLRQIGAGDDGVKVFTGSIVGGAAGVVHMEPAAVRAITDVARQLGKPSFAHPTDRQGLELAVMHGVDILAHTAPLMGEWSADDVRAIVDHRVALIPTLALFEQANNSDTPAAFAVQQTRSLHDAGGVVLFGTDVGFTNAFDTAAEMRLMREAVGWRGLLASLTTTPAKIFGEATIRGRVAPGYIADLVILAGDPAADSAAMSDVRMVVQAGAVIHQRSAVLVPDR